MKRMKLSAVKQVVKNEVKQGRKVIQLDVRNDIMRVRFNNGHEWTMYLSILAMRLKGKIR